MISKIDSRTYFNISANSDRDTGVAVSSDLVRCIAHSNDAIFRSDKCLWWDISHSENHSEMGPNSSPEHEMTLVQSKFDWKSWCGMSLCRVGMLGWTTTPTQVIRVDLILMIPILSSGIWLNDISWFIVSLRDCTYILVNWTASIRAERTWHPRLAPMIKIQVYHILTPDEHCIARSTRAMIYLWVRDRLFSDWYVERVLGTQRGTRNIISYCLWASITWSGQTYSWTERRVKLCSGKVVFGNC